jgi:hypothetical protein
MAYLEGTTKGPRTYSSVQCGKDADDNIELHSDLVYSTADKSNSETLGYTNLSLVNHSCEPNAAFDLSSSNKSEWHLRALKDIHPGDYGNHISLRGSDLFSFYDRSTVTFFYPSTEWDMAQPFKCKCDEPVGSIVFKF